jgi:hypothetical protein
MCEIKHRIDLVIPLTLQDYERFKILQLSLDRFYRVPGTRWVITREDELEQIRARLTDDGYRVISEDSVIPELKFYNGLRILFGRTHARTLGWFVMQLAHLAVAEIIETEFYLTFDSDVVCTKPVHYADLIKDGRAIPRSRQDDVINPYPEWDEWAERVLGLPRLRINHGVTPELLNRAGVLALQRYLADRVHPGLRRLGNALPTRSLARNLLVSWRSYLLRNLPWIDTVLYDTFLEATGQFEKYHLLNQESTIAGNSVWYRNMWPTWRPEESFTNREDFFFSVLQSNAGLSVEEVWERIRPFLEPGDASVGMLSSASKDARHP